MLSELRTEVSCLGSAHNLGDVSSDPLFHALRALLQETLERTEAIHGTIEALGHSVSCRTETPFRSPRLPSGPIRTLPGSHSTISIPSCAPGPSSREPEPISILYQGRKSGSLALHFAPSSETLRRQQERDALGRELGLRLARIEICFYAHRNLGLDIPLLGSCPALAALEAEIAKVAAVRYPVVLEAEFGANELEMAAAIHCSGLHRDGPFVAAHCSYADLHEFDLRLNDAWSRASGGSLLIQGVDLLNDSAQLQLLCQLRFHQQTHNTARILVSTTSPLSRLEADGKFCRILRRELDVLHIRIPALRERPQDIRLLLEHALQQHGLEEGRYLSEAVVRACAEYSWPGNEAELEQLAIRIAVMTDATCIDLAELQSIASWAPPVALIESDPPAPQIPEVSEWIASFGGDAFEETEEPTPSQRHWLELLAGKLVARQYDSLESFGIGMRRALRYVGDHYCDEISLGQLARESFISVSHLSFLFKRDVGVPFKTLLAAVRIERARQLLLENPRQSITEISLDAGFGDLSHFERTFKRLIGTNPRDYRRQQTTAPLKAPLPCDVRRPGQIDRPALGQS